eukprot:6330316-Prymnesium_polylepis.1
MQCIRGDLWAPYLVARYNELMDDGIALPNRHRNRQAWLVRVGRTQDMPHKTLVEHIIVLQISRQRVSCWVVQYHAAGPALEAERRVLALSLQR